MSSTAPSVNTEATRTGLDRRQLLKVSAWAAPAIIVAAAAPAHAASPDIVALESKTLALSAICENTNSFGETKHGFRLISSATVGGTVTVVFSAQAWGLTKTSAQNNLKSITNPVHGATYSSTAGLAEYHALWTSPVTVTTSTGGGGYNAKQTGTVVIPVNPGQTIEIWQQNTNAFGEPRVEAKITAINGTSVDGPYAKFDLNWGGSCKA